MDEGCAPGQLSEYGLQRQDVSEAVSGTGGQNIPGRESSYRAEPVSGIALQASHPALLCSE